MSAPTTAAAPLRYRTLRYLLPNLITVGSLTFGMLAIVSAMEGRFVRAGWFIVYSVMTDKLDGFTARLVKGASELGVQLDSFADFLNFGVAPAVIWYAYLGRGPSPVQGWLRGVLVAALLLWVFANTFRLARYNIVGCDPRCKRVFFGVPTTLSAGVLICVYLVFIKYGGDWQGANRLDELHLIPGLTLTPAIWKAWPWVILVGALAMVSTIRIPKIGLSKSKFVTGFVAVNLVGGYLFGALSKFPEYLGGLAMIWIVSSLIWGFFSPVARSLRAPPVFPERDPPLGKEPMRPEEDLLPDGDEGDEQTPEPVTTG